MPRPVPPVRALRVGRESISDLVAGYRVSRPTTYRTLHAGDPVAPT